MRLSPVLATVVAIAAPFGSSLSANAQTPNSSNSNQTAEVLTPVTNQGHEVVGVFPASSEPRAKPEVVVPSSIEKSKTTQPLNSSKQTAEALKPVTNQQYKVVGVFPASAPTATKQVIVPRRSTSSTTAQNLLQTPTPETQQQQTSPQTPDSTTTPENTNQPGAEPGQNPPQTPFPSIQQQTPAPETQQQQTPSPSIQQQTPAPETQQQQTPSPSIQQQTPAPETQQQQTPPQAPGTTPAPENNSQPGAEPTSPQIPGNTQPDQQTPEAAEPRVLVSEVSIRAETGQLAPELEDQIYRAIRTQPGRTTTRSQLQEDINSIFATGFFSNVQAVPEDTPLGVRVSFVVRPNPVLTKVQVQANPGTNVPSVLPATTTDEIFKDQYGKILNLRDLQEGIKQLTKRYQDQGYALANVIGAPQVSENGVVTLQVAEGVVENIRVQFRNKEGQVTNDKGQPIRGRTQPYIVTRELELKPGQVFNRNTIQKDLQRVFGLGLFEDVNVSLDPGTDPSRVNVVVNVVERNSGSIGVGAGLSSATGLYGSVSYQQQNLNGRNQKLGAELQLGTREFLFDLRFTDPWIAGDPYRTSYTANIFRRRSISLIFEGDDEEIETFDPNDPDNDNDRPRVVRLGGGVNFTRPLSRNPYEKSVWTASAGLQYQRVTTQDADGDIKELGRLEDTNEVVELSQSGEGKDDLLLLQLGAARDLRNNPLQPTSGSYLRFGVDQSVPIGLGNILLTRLRGSYSQYLPVDFTNFNKGPETLAFNIQGGTILGDLPPYEAFSLGGSNSVRGYDEGSLGSGRSFVQASVEYRFPVFSVVSGALFFDVGSDLGTATRASEVLNKNGTGYGYGVGVRVQSPLGPIRIDYGINDDGDSRINFGIGERF
ncbi:BamA/TamA family outer membrane protein [Mastigocladopsis repens]|uniref:BamA/TamA family outer membrane protein n=1 Tax=Mastigocladopsis repens TaxID=221287 RepID=UPI0003077C6C|nr:BamA/TamA family outer membrane protein [Mastigocladopsis repens]